MPRDLTTQKRVKKERYAAYKVMCAQMGVPIQSQTWWRHANELQQQQDDARRLTPEEHYAYWTERFTLKQIREMAANLDFLSTEQRVVA